MCRAAVTGPQVDVDPPVPAGQLRDLADVRLVRAAADDGAHGADGAIAAIDTSGPGVASIPGRPAPEGALS